VNFYPPDKKPVMARNMRDMFLRMAMSEQDVRTLRGAVRAIAEGRRLRRTD
jgi:tRNA/rRNA methyltransferase